VFIGIVEPPVSYNTQLVDPSQLTSYWQLLDPRWRGKIVASDVRSPGPGGGSTRFMYKHPELGPPFLQRLFGETDVTLSSDQRQMIDWLAQGRFALGVFVSTTQISNAAPLGLPVALVPGEQFKEGAALSSASGSLGLIDRAPHPNAARLFINWLLSREGQAAWQAATREPSLRVDVPKAGLFEALTPKRSVDYTFVSNEEYSRLTGAVLRELINNALERKAS
jgi:iron(III) transport system substrate-binding protein